MGVAAAPSPYLIAVICGMAAFMEVLDMSIANVSLVHIAGSLSASREEATWVLTSYLVANAIILPMTGWLSDRIGRKRYYLGSLAAFTLASVACGLAPSLEMLILGRVVQGMAGGALQPVSQAILNEAFPPHKRGMALAVYGLAVIVGPALGPTLGGFLTDRYSWHWIFLINAPVGMLLFVLGTRMLRDPPAQKLRHRAAVARGGIDYWGFALIATSMGSLQLILDLGQREDWLDSGLIRTLAVVCALGFALMIRRELSHAHPIINLRLLVNRNFAIGNLMMAAMYATLMGATVMMPLLMQTLLGYSALDAGLVMSPAALVMVIMMPLVGRVTGRVDERLLVSLGFVCVSLAMLALGSMSLSIPKDQLIWLRTAQLLGVALLFIPISGLAYVGLPAAELGNATAIINLARNLGGGIGVSLVTTFLARQTQSHQVHLVDRVTPLDPAYQATMAAVAPVLGDPLASHAVIAAEVARQASFLAFMDNFQFLAVAAVLLIPLIWIARRAPQGRGAAATNEYHP